MEYVIISTKDRETGKDVKSPVVVSLDNLSAYISATSSSTTVFVIDSIKVLSDTVIDEFSLKTTK